MQAEEVGDPEAPIGAQSRMECSWPAASSSVTRAAQAARPGVRALEEPVFRAGQCDRRIVDATSGPSRADRCHIQIKRLPNVLDRLAEHLLPTTRLRHHRAHLGQLSHMRQVPAVVLLYQSTAHQDIDSAPARRGGSGASARPRGAPQSVSGPLGPGIGEAGTWVMPASDSTPASDSQVSRGSPASNTASATGLSREAVNNCVCAWMAQGVISVEDCGRHVTDSTTSTAVTASTRSEAPASTHRNRSQQPTGPALG